MKYCLRQHKYLPALCVRGCQERELGLGSFRHCLTVQAIIAILNDPRQAKKLPPHMFTGANTFEEDESLICLWIGHDDRRRLRELKLQRLLL